VDEKEKERTGGERKRKRKRERERERERERNRFVLLRAAHIVRQSKRDQEDRNAGKL